MAIYTRVLKFRQLLILYCSAFYKNIENFNEELKFKIEILLYEGDFSWVDDTLINIKKTLENEDPPNSNLIVFIVFTVIPKSNVFK